MTTYQITELDSVRPWCARYHDRCLEGLEGIEAYGRENEGKKDLRFAITDKDKKGGYAYFLYFDIDGVKREEAEDVLHQARIVLGFTPTPPHLATYTGGGIHIYIPIEPLSYVQHSSYRLNYRAMQLKIETRLKQAGYSNVVVDYMHKWGQHGRVPFSVNGKEKYGGKVKVEILSRRYWETTAWKVLGQPKTQLAEKEEEISASIGHDVVYKYCPLYRLHSDDPDHEIFGMGDKTHEMWLALNTVHILAGRKDLVRSRPGKDDTAKINGLLHGESTPYLYDCTAMSMYGCSKGNVYNSVCLTCAHHDSGNTMALVNGKLPTPHLRRQFVTESPKTGKKTFHLDSYRNFIQNGIDEHWMRVGTNKVEIPIYAYNERDVLEQVALYKRDKGADPWWWELSPHAKLVPPPAAHKLRIYGDLCKTLTIPTIEREEVNTYQGVAVRNGIFYVEDGEVKRRKIERKDRVLAPLDINYTPDSQCPWLEQTLRDATGTEQGYRALLRCYGDALFRRKAVDSQKIYAFMGAPGGFKSGAVDVLETMLRTTTQGADVLVRVDQHSMLVDWPDVSRLQVVVVTEVGTSIGGAACELLKRLSGDEKTSVKRFYIGYVPLTLEGPMILTSNEYPDGLAKTAGMARRILPIRFPQSLIELKKHRDAEGISYHTPPRRIAQTMIKDEVAKSWLLDQILAEEVRFQRGGQDYSEYINEGVHDEIGEHPLDAYFKENYTVTRERARPALKYSDLRQHYQLRGAPAIPFVDFHAKVVKASLERVFGLYIGELEKAGLRFYYKGGQSKGYPYLRSNESTAELQRTQNREEAEKFGTSSF